MTDALFTMGEQAARLLTGAALRGVWDRIPFGAVFPVGDAWGRLQPFVPPEDNPDHGWQMAFDVVIYPTREQAEVADRGTSTGGLEFFVTRTGWDMAVPQAADAPQEDTDEHG